MQRNYNLNQQSKGNKSVATTTAHKLDYQKVNKDNFLLRLFYGRKEQSAQN